MNIKFSLLISFILLFMPSILKAQVTANFTSDIIKGCSPITVEFTDLSTGGIITSWDWDFGNGNISNDTNTQATYNTAGIYVVTLTVS